MASVEAAQLGRITLSGTIEARYETPVAFQVGGRVMERSVDAGQAVSSGQLLFRLDPRDLEQALRVAQADLDTAVAELATAEAETRRSRDLMSREFISDQAFEQVELAERASRERVGAAQARLEQARNALDYASLTATEPGILVDVVGEPGQIVAAGQTMAVIAADGPREVEVSLPGSIGVPAQATLLTDDGASFDLVLRESAGAADQSTRTWQARYRFDQVDDEAGLRLGSVVRVALERSLPGDVLQVPIAALNERGQGAQLWHIVEGRAQAIPAVVVSLDGEHAYVLADLQPGDEVIALGTHLLQPGMPVRALAQD
jgi:RND family efflux transporter MFP subunit